MFSVAIECSAADAELRSGELWDAGCLGIQEEDLPGGRVRLRGFFEAPPPFRGDVRREPDTDWEQETRVAWPPTLVGERLFLCPPWHDGPVPAGRLRLTINPGMALGTGDHPATRACLVALERHVNPGAAVLDLGCGSGILGAAALLLGAGAVVGCDIDPPSLAVAAGHVRFPLFAGSLRSVGSASVDLIVANINATVLGVLSSDLARVARRKLILSGFRCAESVSIQVPGFSVIDRLAEDNWSCLVFSKDAPS